MRDPARGESGSSEAGERRRDEAFSGSGIASAHDPLVLLTPRLSSGRLAYQHPPARVCVVMGRPEANLNCTYQMALTVFYFTHSLPGPKD